MSNFGCIYNVEKDEEDENFRESERRIEELKNSEYGLNGVGIEIVNSRCQIKCKHCLTGRDKIKNMEDGIGKEIAIKRRDSSDMSFKQVKDIVDQSVEVGAKEIYFIGAGETTLHPQLPEILRYTSKKLKSKNRNDFLIVAATNGIKLADERYCKELVETEAVVFPHFYVLGTGDKEMKILSEVIGKPLELTKKIAKKQEKGRENLMKFSREKYGNLSKVAFDHCLVPATVRSGQTKKVFEYCTNLGVGTLFFEMARTSCGIQRDSEFLLPLDEYIKIYDELYEIIPEGDRKAKTPPRVNGSCTMVKTGIHIITSGDILPCCGTYIEMGNVFKTPLKEILESPIRNVFRNIERYKDGHCTKCEYFPKKCIGSCTGDIFQTYGCPLSSSLYCHKIEENLTTKDIEGKLECKGCALEYESCRKKEKVILASPHGGTYEIKGILKGGN